MKNTMKNAMKKEMILVALISLLATLPTMARAENGKVLVRTAVR